MANFQTIKGKPAIKGYTVQDLSSTHITTMDIGQIVPLKTIETVIGGRYPIKGNEFARLAPLAKPTYGKMYFKTCAMFIPYYQIADNIDGFVNGNVKVKGEVAKSRYVRLRTILEVFTSSQIITEVSSADVATGAWYDLTCLNNATTKYYKFTNTGRYYIKVLNALGYVIPQNGNIYNQSTWYKGYGAKFRSALPLIAFAKGYNDWMSQSQRFNSSTLTKLLYAIKHDKTYTFGGNVCYDSSTHELTKFGVIALLDGIRLGYENDYFTSAWQHPNAPLEGEEYNPGGTTNGNIDNAALDENSYYVQTDSDNILRTKYHVVQEEEGSGNEWPITGIVAGEEEEEETVILNGNPETRIGARALRWLNAWDNYVNRNNYSGSKDVQQIASRFGIKVEDYKAEYAHVITTSKAPIQIGDVTALAQDYVSEGNANNIDLGDYSGKGIINTSQSFKYKADEIGLLCVYAWITVAPMNVFGEDKKVRRVTPMDFYTPEFDGIGPEPIGVDEVYVNPRITSSTAPDAVFGFTEKYNSYRFANDQITGDFRKFPLASGTYANVGTENNCWHLGRFLNTQLMNQTLVAQNPSINLLEQTESEYNRIFSRTNGDEDHFYITAQYDCQALLPILSLNQVPRLGEGKLNIAKNGNEIN